MDCPRCTVELTEIQQNDHTLHRCPDCGGHWVDVTEMNRILLHANLPALSALGGYVNPDEIAGMCPACNVDLVTVEGGEKRMLKYDTCESCGGIWLDGPEEGDVAETSDWNQAEKEIVSFYRAFRKR